jgi:hypothetical protein
MRHMDAGNKLICQPKPFGLPVLLSLCPAQGTRGREAHRVRARIAHERVSQQDNIVKACWWEVGNEHMLLLLLLRASRPGRMGELDAIHPVHWYLNGPLRGAGPDWWPGGADPFAWT